MRGRLLAAFVFCAVSAFAQISPIEQAVEYLVEFAQTENEDIDLVQIAEQLSYLQGNPVPINSATADELLEIPLLNSFLAFNLLEYRNRSGRILSLYQLADVKGFSPRLIKILAPFVTLETERQTKIFPTHFTHQLAVRYRQLFQESRGFAEGSYAGDRSENYLRYRLQGQGKLFAGLTAQRDPGENWLTQQNTPEFLSMHLEYRGTKTIKNIVVGDFSAEFGQGLTLWNSLAFNKSADALNIVRFGRGLRHYTGTDENRFLRGAGTTLRFGQVEVMAFYSLNRADANVVSIDSTSAATSLQTSGLHRTASEIEDRHSQQIQIVGTHIEWRPTRLRLGFSAINTQFKYALLPNDRPENSQRFAGSELFHTSLDWKYLYGRMFFFGEAGYEWLNQRSAVTTGVQIQAADALQYVVQYRLLQTGWYAPFIAPFSETGRDGEQGMYIGVNWQLPKNLRLAMFADFFQYLWLRSTLNRPGNGSDYMAQLNYQPYNFSAYLRVRYQIRPETLAGTETIREAADTKRLSIRGHTNIPVTEKLNLQLRAEWVQYTHDQRFENGLLSFVGFGWRMAEKWQFKARYTIFDTKSYASAIWAYEDDVPYSYTVPAYFYGGTKWYAVVSWQALQQLELWLRISDAWLPEQTTLGSGLDQLPTNRRTEIKVMARMNF